MPKQDPEYTKISPWRVGHEFQNIFTISDNQGYTKNSCAKSDD